LTSEKAFDTIGFIDSGHTGGGSVSKSILFITVAIVVSLSVTNAIHAVKGNSKINDCLKSKNCKFIVTGTATEDPRMSFLVQEKTWKAFTVLDKNDLKRILKTKISLANEKPDKHVHISKKAPSYDRLRKNIENMRSYSVFLSYGKDTRGNLQLDEEILVNY
jgi:hypothetical protein